MASSEAAKVEALIQAYKSRVLGLGPDLTMDERRTATDGIGEWATLRTDVATSDVQLGARMARRFEPAGARAGHVVLYFHGGGYVMGSLNSHGRLMQHLAHHLGVSLYGLDFRRAPEHPFPAALDDAVAAYRALVDEGWDPQQIVLGGDSAGGGLVLATMGALRDAGEQLPLGGILLSAWLDLELTAESMQSLAEVDPWTTRPTLEAFAQMYAGSHPASDWRISPLHMDFAGLPPLVLHVSDTEILRDDTVRAAQRAAEAGVDVTTRGWEGVPHVFQMFAGQLPEAEESLVLLREWFDAQVTAPPS